MYRPSLMDLHLAEMPYFSAISFIRHQVQSSGVMRQSLQSFPQEVIDKIGNYVYRLIDPRNGETFYIGKG